MNRIVRSLSLSLMIFQPLWAQNQPPATEPTSTSVFRIEKPVSSELNPWLETDPERQQKWVVRLLDRRRRLFEWVPYTDHRQEWKMEGPPPTKSPTTLPPLQ